MFYRAKFAKLIKTSSRTLEEEDDEEEPCDKLEKNRKVPLDHFEGVIDQIDNF